MSVLIFKKDYILSRYFQEGTMYVLWGKGSQSMTVQDSHFLFPNETSHKHGMQMMQLLRADKILIPEK